MFGGEGARILLPIVLCTQPSAKLNSQLGTKQKGYTNSVGKQKHLKSLTFSSNACRHYDSRKVEKPGCVVAMDQSNLRLQKISESGHFVASSILYQFLSRCADFYSVNKLVAQ